MYNNIRNSRPGLLSFQPCGTSGILFTIKLFFFYLFFYSECTTETHLVIDKASQRIHEALWLIKHTESWSKRYSKHWSSMRTHSTKPWFAIYDAAKMLVSTRKFKWLGTINVFCCCCCFTVLHVPSLSLFALPCPCVFRGNSEQDTRMKINSLSRLRR